MLFLHFVADEKGALVPGLKGFSGFSELTDAACMLHTVAATTVVVSFVFLWLFGTADWAVAVSPAASLFLT